MDGCNDSCAYGNSGNNAAAKGRKTSLSRWKFCVHADKRQMLQVKKSVIRTKFVEP